MILKIIALSIALSLSSFISACQTPTSNTNPEAPRSGQESENTSDPNVRQDNDGDDDDRQQTNPQNNQQDDQDDDNDNREKRGNRNNKQDDDD